MTLTIPDDLRKDYVAHVGEILVRNHGKQPFYSPEDVKTASSQVSDSSKDYSFIDWHCWAMCVFCARGDFDVYHQSIGENCDYASMKGEMMAGLSGGTLGPDFDADASWLELRDFDLSSIFEWFSPI